MKRFLIKGTAIGIAIMLTMQNVYADCEGVIADGIVITRIENGYTTSGENINFNGACNPEEDLYINGERIEITEHGFFNYYAGLKIGENKFLFENGKEKKEYKINRIAKKAQTGSNMQKIEDTSDTERFAVIKKDNATARTRPDEADDDLFEPYVKGTTARIIGETANSKGMSDDEAYYKLDNGTYIYRSSAEVYTGNIQNNKIKDMLISDNAEKNSTEMKMKMSMAGTYDVEFEKNKATITLFSTEETIAPKVANNKMIKKINRVTSKGDKSIYVVYFKENIKVSGYYVEFNNDVEMTIGFKNAATLEKDSLKGSKIIVDAGHGAEQLGAVGSSMKEGYNEKDINLSIAKKLKEYLEGKGAEVIMIRDDDTFVPLADRTKKIREINPDLSISIHANSLDVVSDFEKRQGTIVYHSFKEANNVSEFMSEKIGENSGLGKATTQVQNLAMTRLTNCPAILIETGFLSNNGDYEWLIKKRNQENMAQSIGMAAEKYLKENCY